MIIPVRCSSTRPSVSPIVDHLSKSSLASSVNFKPLLKKRPEKRIIHHVSTAIKEAFVRMLDALVDSVFEFVDQPLLPSQANFAPVAEIGKAADATDSVKGTIPDYFPVGVYIRNVNRLVTQKAPGSEELVIMGIHPEKPYYEVGVISADGDKLLHKVDLNLNRFCLCHEIGITKEYNVILDFPLTIDMNRLISGGPLMKYHKEGYARIGVTPRYGDANSVQWFEVKPCFTFHIINCYEQDDDVVVLACRARNAIIPGPDFGLDKFEWFSKRFKQIGSLDEKSEDESFLHRAYEWRLNMKTGEVSEKNLTGSDKSMDFPMINEKYIGNKNKFGYTQVINPKASTISGMAKYGGLAKLYLQEDEKQDEELIKVEYHWLPENTFCTGSVFVTKPGNAEEDDGWIVTYVHNEVYIVDTKNLSDEPVAIIDLPARVPYGFHGAFMPVQ